MASQLDVACKAIQDEINRLGKEQRHLEGVLAALNQDGTAGRQAASEAVIGSTKGNDSSDQPKKRGRPRKNPAPAAGDVKGAMKLIEAAGREGVNSIALSYQIKNAGLAKPSKAELIDSGKVKVMGKGGGMIYKFMG